jgi:hypothetical protein
MSLLEVKKKKKRGIKPPRPADTPPKEGNLFGVIPLRRRGGAERRGGFLSEPGFLQDFQDYQDFIKSCKSFKSC